MRVPRHIQSTAAAVTHSSAGSPTAWRFGRRRWLGLAVGVASGAGGLALVGCGGVAQGGSDAAQAQLTSEGLPRYAYRSEPALTSYRYAVAQPALLSQLPCYCGCGQLPEFENLRDCFIGGTGQFNSHGSNCQTCTDEALDAKRMQAEGRPVAEIRRVIDASYKGRGKPTNTPPVA